MEKEFYYIAIPVVLVLFCFFGFVMHFANRGKNLTTNGVRNTDVFTHTYFFKVSCSGAEFLEQLVTGVGCTAHKYTFLPDKMLLTLSHGTECTKFTLSMQECEDGCLIRLAKENMIFGGNSHTNINNFMMEAFHAELLPYEEYKDLFLE